MVDNQSMIGIYIVRNRFKNWFLMVFIQLNYGKYQHK